MITIGMLGDPEPLEGVVNNPQGLLCCQSLGPSSGPEETRTSTFPEQPYVINSEFVPGTWRAQGINVGSIWDQIGVIVVSVRPAGQLYWVPISAGSRTGPW